MVCFRYIIVNTLHTYNRIIIIIIITMITGKLFAVKKTFITIFTMNQH
jgi:hypothetical protein